MQLKTRPTASRTALWRYAGLGLLAAALSLSTAAQEVTPPANNTNQTSTPAPATTAATMEQVVKMNPFVVAGSYAGSLEMAALAKQDASAIVEVIVPEDIGKLPDVSIADDLDRLTGLTSQRVNGRAQQINIRGFSPDFSVGTLDGVEQATTNDNRAVEYDQYPSELIGGVVVYKSGQASLVGGLAGTVDLRTTSPLDFDSRIVALSAFYNFTGLAQQTPGVKKAGESYTVSYVDQFAKGTEGIYFGFAHTENPYTGQQYGSWGFTNANDGSAIMNSLFGTTTDQIGGGMKFYDQAELLKRDSVVFVLESKPNDNVHSKFDAFYSKFDDNQLLDGMQMGVLPNWADYREAGDPAVSTPQMQPGYTVTNGVVTNYTIKNVLPVIEDLVTRWKDKTESVIWNLDLAQKSDWPVHFQAGWSRATRAEEVLEDYADLGSAGTTASGLPGATWQVNFNGGPDGIPSIVSTGVNFGDPSVYYSADQLGWGAGTYPVTGQEGYLKYLSESDEVDSGKLSVKHDLKLPIFDAVEIGVSNTQREKTNAQWPTGYLVNSNGQGLAPPPPFIGTTNLSWIASGMNTMAWDSNAWGVESGKLTYISNPNVGDFVGDDYDVKESITRPYVQADLKGTLGGIPYEGNVGVMVDLASQSSTGFSGGDTNQTTPVSASESYSTVLPSLNLIFKPTKQDDIRLFLGRQEQRPRMYDMRAGRDFSYNAQYQASTTLNESPWSAYAGNPNLRPWLANSVDLSLEHYFEHGEGYVSLAAFDKKLLNYIYQQQELTDFTGYPYTSALPPVLSQGLSSQFVNGQGGNVSGVEVTVQVTSELLTGRAVKGFGFVANGLLVDSSIQPWGPGNGTAPLPDMSKKSMNLTLYYERGGFSARINDHYQSPAREYIVQFGAPSYNGAESPNDGFSIEKAFFQIDAQIGYTWKRGALKGLGVFLEGRNLNNAALITLNNGNALEVTNWQRYGAAYRAGVTLKF